MRSLLVIGWIGGCGVLLGWWAFGWGGRTAWFLVYVWAFFVVYLGLFRVAAGRGLRIERLSDGMEVAPEHIQCGSSADRFVYSGEPVTMAYRLSAAWLPLFGGRLRVEERWVHEGTGERIVRRGTAEAGFRRDAVMRCTVHGLARGVYRQEALIVSAVDAFGLVQAKRESAGGGQLWALPGGSGTATPLPGAAPEGARPASRRPPGSDPVPQVSGTRPYAPGDPLRRIHWRSSARTGELRAKETELPAAGRQLIVLDAAGAGGSAGAALWADPALAAAAEAAAGLARRALEQGARVRLAVSDGQSGAAEAQGRGRDGELLRLLAAVPRGEARADAFAELALREARSAGGAALTLVTARADAQLAAALRGLPRGAARVVYVHEPGAAWPGPAHAWVRQLEALGCPVTILASHRPAAAPRGGAADAAIGT
ncbi:Uncharacterized conserved protein, DUF58 family, contains vWF domain [Paenibacillus tianmuensis]|uniref:Uncharacterized conserved protein, DUF58 family, contains vWF domain n=1 Tax=Paenibacillus tianmuensis TaxID=624147 RepID=A0A1G4T442_9BACL|nr:DUF58 domain-containing protein [Paenibacillus tianmuensis]SCW76210.1 Uncharacterized conserved protein, DUF58 family, contains vWF domain [Paenibacillus tianmuensis]